MRLLRWILALAPRRFRERYGEDVVECYRDAWQNEVRGRGWWGRLVFRMSMVGATTVVVARQWLSVRRRREEGREMMDSIRQAGRFAGRRLVRRPGYAAAVVLTLALGLGANAAVFSVLHSVLLRPLPYQDGHELVRVYGSRLDRPEMNRLHLPTPALLELREQVNGLAGVTAIENQSPGGVDITDGPVPERLRQLPVDADYFDVLGVAPVLGRTFHRSEERAGAGIAVVSARIWDEYVGGGPSSLGATLTLDGEAVAIVGVVPDSFQDPLEGPIDVFVPLDVESSVTNWDNNWLTVYGRRGASVESLRSELDGLEARHADMGSAVAERGFAVVDLRSDLVGDADVVLFAVMGAVVLLLLMTAVNVASLMMAQGAARVRELAVRVSMGAPRRDLLEGFLAEALILSVAGGLAGLLLGQWALDAVVAIAPEDLPALVPVRTGPEVLAATALASVVLGLALGIVTAIPFVRPGPRALVGGSRSGGATPGAQRVRGVLVRVEVALAAVLLIGASAMLRTVQALNAQDLGAEPDGVLTFEVGLPGARYDSDEAIYDFSRRLHEEIERVPGVRAAAVTSRLPVTGSFNTWGTKRAHGPDAPFDTPNQAVNQRWIAGDYFDAVGLSILQGRDFDATDEADAPYRTVVNQALVAALYGDEDPIGSWIRMAGRYAMVIGVVEDEALTARSPAAPVAYHHQRQWISGSRRMTQVVRLDASAPDVLPDLRRAVSTIDPALVLFQPRMLRDVIGRSVSAERFAAILLGVFALLAIAVAGVGLYAILAHHVAQQRHEIGVRRALGAERVGLVRMVVGRGVVLAGTGLLGGVVFALLLGGSIEPLLYGVSARDPVAFGVGPLILGVVAIVASVVPALHATRVEPVEAFRGD